MPKQAPFMFHRTPTGLSPADGRAADMLQNHAMGADFIVRPDAKRSHRQNGLYWAVLHETVKATDKWATPEHLHVALKMALGFRTQIITMKGVEYWIPDSTAFEKMDAGQFKEYFDSAMALLSEVVGHDVLYAYYEITGQNVFSEQHKDVA